MELFLLRVPRGNCRLKNSPCVSCKRVQLVGLPSNGEPRRRARFEPTRKLQSKNTKSLLPCRFDRWVPRHPLTLNLSVEYTQMLPIRGSTFAAERGARKSHVFSAVQIRVYDLPPMPHNRRAPEPDEVGGNEGAAHSREKSTLPVSLKRLGSFSRKFRSPKRETYLNHQNHTLPKTS